MIATLSIEEINQDREKFLELINENVGQELNKIGLELINVNIRDITDESRLHRGHRQEGRRRGR